MEPGLSVKMNEHYDFFSFNFIYFQSGEQAGQIMNQTRIRVCEYSFPLPLFDLRKMC